jgi:hypothetical protein
MQKRMGENLFMVRFPRVTSIRMAAGTIYRNRSGATGKRIA